ncbi:MAG: hypothetical protein AMXMBFR84_30730 [Candidatus Hydrogenedentota bacterium]
MHMDNPLFLAISLLLGGLIAFAFSLELFKEKYDARRVRSAIAKLGGKMVSIEWNAEWGSFTEERDGRHYTVVYTNREGHTVQAVCKTRAWKPVEWIQSSEPDIAPRPADKS